MTLLVKKYSAIDYIEANLADEIDFNIVAMKACCSSYNFQLMFSFIADITLAEYINGRLYDWRQNPWAAMPQC